MISIKEKELILETRNIGICAHIDAGKTTLTERILFYTGRNHSIGEVHDGKATMDWMDQEQERGITINSASTTVHWKHTISNINCKINLIDTPGHVDFTAEVERTMRVLDGICLVLCSVGGVQSQTESIWRQVRKYLVPSVCFVNKMDRKGANFERTCNELKDKLKIDSLILQYPIFKKGEFCGIYDLIFMKEFYFHGKNGEVVSTKDIEKENHDLYKKRNCLIENLIKDDENLIELYLKDELKTELVIKLIRKKTITCEITPVLCGSAFKNKGVQTLLNYVIDLFPSPLEKEVKCYCLETKKTKNIRATENKFSAVVFKVINDPYSGRISFSRIYSGRISCGDFVLNSNTNKKERIGRIIFYNVNKKIESKSANCGDIVAFVGLKTTQTGHTLCSCDFGIVFEEITFPEPVISYSVYTNSDSNYEKMLNSLSKLSIEDPTILVKTNKETGDLVISGMGELHIDVFLERIKREFGIPVFKRNPKVSFKETVSSSSINNEGKYIRQSGGRGQYGHVVISIFPRKIGKGFKFVNSIKSGAIPNEYIDPIKKSIQNCCLTGFLIGSPIVDIKVELTFGSFHEVDSNENAFKIAASLAFKKAFLNAKPIILEPIMLVSVECPKEYLGSIISDISSRRGEIISNEVSDFLNILKANIPMLNMFNYTTSIRSKTKGRATYSMSFGFYRKVPSLISEGLIKNDS
ncbi:elongation factor G [Candidatus Vidania fulgoroideorum]